MAAPSVSVYQLGNMDYYDFPMRDLFEKIDSNKDGILSFDELCKFLEESLGEDYSKLDTTR